MTIKVGDKIPEATFKHVAWTPELASGAVCGVVSSVSTKDWAGKKVVLFAVPGAFTSTCHVEHLPPYLQKIKEFKAKGIDEVAVLAANDAFVMSGWGRVLGVKDEILLLSDGDAAWSKSIGLDKDLSSYGLGIRTGRYAIVLDDLVVKYLGVEPAGGVTVSGAEEVLAAL